MITIKFDTKIHIGDDSLTILNDFKDENIIIISDNFISSSPFMDTLTSQIDRSCEVRIFDEVQPDPPIENLVSGLEMVSEFSPTIFIAFGGGSAIDAGKGIYFFAKRMGMLSGNIPFIVVPTTSGTGSEVTNFSIITDQELGVKYPLVTDEIQPTDAILVVDFVESLPPNQTADTGVDVLTHAIEAYVSTASTEISDALAEKAIKYVFEYLPRAYRDGSDREAREKMHIASTMAGMAFNQASLGLNHGIAHAAGARLHIPHGRLNGILLTEVIRFNSGLVGNQLHTEVADRYRQIAGFLDLNAVSPSIGTRSLINEITKLLKSTERPLSLSGFGIDKAKLENYINEIAKDALLDACTDTNPIEPSEEDVIAILKNVF
ncbi:alcohol dehydrogenase [Suicoccus acidiformans]|uniref:Alcohol dehydrogenase n=1 Tax=Suicoccus acidiformans TaxID=2036206 RepID=A0A347WLZ5_9LACT|nr:1-propanol dehydrogenase PduQ [Suicoccus acidiformans]AXY26102.1 alcohol dehydrogenase [Suicoccus acidiformans]